MSSGLLGFMSAYHHNIKLLPGFKPPFPTEHDMQSLTECPSGPLASVGHYIHIADFIRVPPLLFAFGLCLSFPSQSQDWSEIIIVALRRKLINLWRGNYSSRQCGFNVIHACTQISFFFFFFSKCITQTESLWTEGQSEQNCNALKNFFAHSKKMRPGRKMLDAFSFSCSVILKTQALTNYFYAGENTRQNENSQGTSVLRVYNSEERNKLFLWTLHKKKNISSGSCTLAHISHVNKLPITPVEQDFVHRADNTVDRCWEKSRDWSFAVGVSAFRKELSAEARVGEGGLSRLCRNLSFIPRGIAVRRQGAEMPYMFISTQIRLVCIPHL